MATTTPSRAAALFEQIKTAPNPFDYISQFITDKFTEGEILDYKGAAHLDTKPDDVKNIWSKSLGAFANSDGGVLIWGVHAPANVPHSVSLVKDVHRFKARLLQLQPAATEPPVQGVEIEAFESLTNPPEGFVVCLIPPSLWRPHESQWSDRRYYVRIGDNCVPASHSLLKALFQGTVVSRLEIHAQANHSKDPTHIVLIDLIGWLTNTGPSSAYDIFAVSSFPVGTSFQKRGDFWNAGATALPGNTFYAKRPLHPTESVELFNVRIGSVQHGTLLLPTSPLEFSIKVFSKHQPMQQFAFVLTEQAISAETRIRAARV